MQILIISTIRNTVYHGVDLTHMAVYILHYLLSSTDQYPLIVFPPEIQ